VNKGIVMEQHPHYTIIMTKDGLFQKAVPIKDVPVGCEVYYHPLVQKKTPSFFFQFKRFVSVPTAVLAMMCLIILLSLPIYFSTTTSKTYAYVNVDINPSVEMELNKKLQVTSVSALNNDATSLIENLNDVEGETLETVLKEVIRESEANGLTKNGKNMILGINYVDEQDRGTIDIDHLNLSSEWGIVTLNIPEEIREIAKKEHQSMNEVIINENPDNIQNLNTKDIEIIHSFYKLEQPERDQDSSKMNKNKEKNMKQKTIDSGKIKDKTVPKEKTREKTKDNNNHLKDKQNPSKKKGHKQPKTNHKKPKKQLKPPGQQKKQNKHKQHEPPGQQKKQNKHKQHKPPGQQKKQNKHKQHKPPGQQKKQNKHKQHEPPGQQKKQNKHKQHEPPGQKKQNKHKKHTPPGQQKKQNNHKHHQPPGQQKKKNDR